MTFVKAIIIFT